MDRERLEQYRHIEAALKLIRKDIAQINKAINRSTSKVIPDIARGSSSEFPYIETRFKIESYDFRKKDRYMAKLRRREADYEEKLLELEEWLEAEPDPLIYSIIKLKLRNNLTDEEIGAELGYSRSRITQILNNYLEKNV